jgi:hypothetical protein
MNQKVSDCAVLEPRNPIRCARNDRLWRGVEERAFMGSDALEYVYPSQTLLATLRVQK